MTLFTFWHWFGVALILLVAEMLGAAGFLLWTGISAAIIGLLLLVFPNIPTTWQLVIFSLVTIGVLYVWWRKLQKRIDTSDQPLLNQRSAQYIGRQTVLVEPLTNGRGTVRIDDSRWLVTGPELPKGAFVKVVGLEDAMLLIVEPIEQDGGTEGHADE